MINEINIQQRNHAEQVRQLQLLSYRVEADLINFYDLPSLKDTVQSLQTSSETFLGYYISSELYGAIAYQATPQTCTICRLIVHPDHFRKSIAQTLFLHLQKRLNGEDIIVTTAARNTPAIAFYQRNGFRHERNTQVAEALTLATFRKEGEKVT